MKYQENFKADTLFPQFTGTHSTDALSISLLDMPMRTSDKLWIEEYRGLLQLGP